MDPGSSREEATVGRHSCSVKLAAFKVTQVYSSGNPKGIRGEFQYYVQAGPPAPDDGGLRMVHLIQ